MTATDNTHSGLHRAFGRYTLSSVLGRGAMGTVYRAHAPDGGRVALKTINTDLLAGAEAEEIIARFRREASIGLTLDHPRIVRVIDEGEADGVLYLAMELVPGRELKSVAAEGRVSLADAVGFVGQLLGALAYVHERGIVHRDIKLANILVLDDRSIKLMDFGVARLPGSDMTQHGSMIGSPAFMAPEQFAGGDVDHRSDLFAVGVILYTLLVGRPPFRGALPQVMHQVLYDDPAPPSEAVAGVAPGFDAIVLTALAKERDRRFADARRFAEALAICWERASPAAAVGDRTVVAPRPAAPVGGAPSALPDLDGAAMASRLAAVLEGAADRVEESAVAELRDRLAPWLGEVTPQAGRAVDSGPLRAVLTSAAVPALAARVVDGAPVPGRPVEDVRTDWMATVELLVLLRRLAEGFGSDGSLAFAVERAAVELSRSFVAYSGRLNRDLFADDDPDLARIAGELMRLDVVLLGLERLGAESEIHAARAAIRTCAGLVIAKANGIIDRFALTGDGLARFGVANLLVEVDELIAIADRLLESDEPEGTDVAIDALGLEAVARFIDNAGSLARIIVDEVRAEVEAGEADAGAFGAKLRQLGLIYMFATRLRAQPCRTALRQLITDVHGLLDGLTEQVTKTLMDALAEGADGSAPADRKARARNAFAQLTEIFELADRFGWVELNRGVLLTLRRQIATGDGLRDLLGLP